MLERWEWIRHCSKSWEYDMEKTGTIPVLTVFTISHKNTNDEYTTMKINSSLTITGAMKKTKHSQEKGTKIKKNMTLLLSEGLAFELS